jgi:hypothetical protein
MQEVRLYASRREGSVVSLQEHHTHDVVTDVALTLQLEQQHIVTRVWREMSTWGLI